MSIRTWNGPIHHGVGHHNNRRPVVNTFLISYDLLRPGQNYAKLYEAIKDLAAGWWHQIDSTWIIRHHENTISIRDSLMPFIDQNDKLIVLRLSGEAAWKGFDSTGSQWLKNYL